MRIKAEFYYESDEVTIHIRIPLEDYQKLRQYQSQYPKAILESLDGEYEHLNNLAEKQRVELGENQPFEYAAFLRPAVIFSVRIGNKALWGSIRKMQTIQEALELFCQFGLLPKGKKQEKCSK